MDDSNGARPSASDFAALCARVDRMGADLAENTASTNRLESSTSDLIDAFSAIRGGLTVLSWIGKVGLPIGAMLLAGWQMLRD